MLLKKHNPKTETGTVPGLSSVARCRGTYQEGFLLILLYL